MKVPLTPPFNLPFPAQPFFSVSHPHRPFLLPIFFISSASLTFPDYLPPSYVFPLKFLSLFFFSSPSFLLHIHFLPSLSICSYFPHLPPSSLTISFRPLSHRHFLLHYLFCQCVRKATPEKRIFASSRLSVLKQQLRSCYMDFREVFH